VPFSSTAHSELQDTSCLGLYYAGSLKNIMRTSGADHPATCNSQANMALLIARAKCGYVLRPYPIQ
jgi:hypothetical protein